MHQHLNEEYCLCHEYVYCTCPETNSSDSKEKLGDKRKSKPSTLFDDSIGRPNTSRKKKSTRTAQ